MRIKTGLYLGAATIALALALAGPSAPLHAQAPTPVAIDNDDIGGVVTGPNGPEAGVWVIAETRDLPTRFAKIVVTDDQGRYRGNIDQMYTIENTPVGCSKPGYEFVRVVKRPGPTNGTKQTIQADCVLHKIK